MPDVNTTPAAAGAAAGAAPVVTPPAAGAANVLAGAAGTAFEQIPERYRVFKADKTPDLEASAIKLNGGYAELHQKMVAGGVPPATPEEYKIEGEVDGVKFDELKKEPGVQAALKRFHAKGMSNAQVKEVLEFFVGDGIAEVEKSAADCEKTLRDTWKSDADYKGNALKAHRATQAVAGKLGVPAEQLFKAYGNDPLIVRVFALIGADMAEDGGIGGDAGGVGIANTVAGIETRVGEIQEELTKLTSHDPKRKTLLAEKTKLFERKVELQKRVA